jgi:hypothetical protein
VTSIDRSIGVGGRYQSVFRPQGSLRRCCRKEESAWHAAALEYSGIALNGQRNLRIAYTYPNQVGLGAELDASNPASLGLWTLSPLLLPSMRTCSYLGATTTPLLRCNLQDQDSQVSPHDVEQKITLMFITSLTLG